MDDQPDDEFVAYRCPFGLIPGWKYANRSGSYLVGQGSIYDGMTFDNQNDKEFAISGTRSRELMACARLAKPIITKDEIKHIILGGGENHLGPERRIEPDFSDSIRACLNHA